MCTLGSLGSLSPKVSISLKLCWYQSLICIHPWVCCSSTGSRYSSFMMLARRTGTSWRRKMNECSAFWFRPKLIKLWMLTGTGWYVEYLRGENNEPYFGSKWPENEMGAS